MDRRRVQLGSDRSSGLVSNLKATPEVRVTYGGRTECYVAREATGDERREYWEQASEVNPGLETYQ